ADGAQRVGAPEEIAAWLGRPDTPLCGPAAPAVAAAGGGVFVAADPPDLDVLAQLGADRPTDAGARPLYLRPAAVTPAAQDAAAHLRR
ncbi:MAG: hypothetical protein AAF684_07215, partial [Pseudomonadota bacterium]